MKGNLFPAILAGGGLCTGQIVGLSNPRGEHPISRVMLPADLLATVYHVLGIDPANLQRSHGAAVSDFG